MKKTINILSLTIIVLYSLVACETEYDFRGDAESIRFSVDTLSFDTVFAGAASTTVKLMIYNTSGENMTIDRISLAGGDESKFNVNINGANSTSVDGIRLRADDSLFVFVNVFPSENNGEALRKYDDDIVVRSGANTWSAHLTACAQNVIRVSGHIANDTQWTSSLPYLLSGTVCIDSMKTLTIEEGAHVYFENGSGLNVYGSLVCNGTKDGRVRFSSVRKDDFYNDIPGCWESVFIMQGTGSATLNYTEIANAKYGLLIDTLTTAVLNNVVVRDAMYAAVVTYAAHTTLENCVLYNCGGPLLAIQGGSCSMVNSTLSNHFRWSVRKGASLSIVGGGEMPQLDFVTIANSVVVGNFDEEVSFSESVNSSNCLVVNSYLSIKDDEYDFFENVIVGSNPGFVDYRNFDFHLDEKSLLIDAANVEYAQQVPFDADGNSRIDDIPDIGAFEYIKKRQ